MRKSVIEKANALVSSDYHVLATGLRDVDFNELCCLIDILTKKSACDVSNNLKSLYKNHPKTIAMSKAHAESACSMFNSECDCFLPDVEELWCDRTKNERESRNRFTPQYSEWRASVFERDSFTCSDCGVVGGELNAHHIKAYAEYPDLRLDINNGVTLCVNCHKNRHKKNGE